MLKACSLVLHVCLKDIPHLLGQIANSENYKYNIVYKKWNLQVNGI